MDNPNIPLMKSNLVCHCLRLHPGEELYKSLLSYVKAHNLKAPFIMTCCGSLIQAKLRLAAHVASFTDSGNCIKEFEGPFEIISLVGLLSGDEGHLHISLSDKDGHVIGGHVIGDLIIFTTAEVVIGECTDLEFPREFDRETGFPELVIKSRTTKSDSAT